MKGQKYALSSTVVLAVAVVVMILLSCTCPSPISPLAPAPTQPIGGADPVMVTFTADHTTIAPGECATLRWDVQGGYGGDLTVELNGQSVSRSLRKTVCPQHTTTYVLSVTSGGNQVQREIVIHVTSGGSPPTAKPPTAPPPTAKPPTAPPPTKPPTARPPTATPTTTPAPPGVTVNFWADSTNIMAGNCTTLHWDVEHATAVYLNGAGVAGHAAQQVCPPSTATYTLRVEYAGGVTEKQVTITVTPIPGGGGGGILTADLAVTDLYPDNMPQGSVWVRITNHGHGTVTNVEIQLSVSAVRTEYVGGAKITLVQAPRSITINLAPGQTAAFDTRLKVNTSQYWYQVTANIQVPFKDPNPSNDSYTETIPPPP